MSRDVFEKSGRNGAGRTGAAFGCCVREKMWIPYRLVSLTPAAHSVDEQTPLGFIIKDLTPALATGKNKRRAATPEKRKRSERSER